MNRLAHWTTFVGIATLIGAVSGSLSAIFLLSLDTVTHIRLEHPWLIYLLPLAGIATGYAYQRWGKQISGGNQLLIEEITTPKQRVPLRMMPMVLIGTLVTHLFGGSAGREGTAIQMGGAVADHIGHTRWTRRHKLARPHILMAGIAAGFASVFGTPIAGIVFAFEVLGSDRQRWTALLAVVVAALTAHHTCLIWGVHHAKYLVSEVPNLTANWNTLMIAVRVGLAGVIFGILASAFVWLTHQIKSSWSSCVASRATHAFWGGAIVIGLTLLLSTNQYLGLGLPQIRSAFEQTSSVLAPMLKIIFTAITVGSGFQGGEVTPLFFIGATAGSAFAAWLSLNLSFATALGFVTVFGAAAKTPLAATAIAYELFGAKIVPFALLACVVARLVTSHDGLYQPKRH